MNKKIGLYEVIEEASDMGFIVLNKDEPKKAKLIKRAASLGYLRTRPGSFAYETTQLGESILIERHFELSKNKRQLFGFWNKMTYDNRIILLAMIIIAIVTVFVTVVI